MKPPCIPERSPPQPISPSPGDSASHRLHWLCIAYAFPPINRSGTHRTLGFVKHLDRLGWQATVLTVTPRGEPQDASLVRGIPASTRIIRTEWIDWPERIKRLFPHFEPRAAPLDAKRQGSAREDSPSAATYPPGAIPKPEARVCQTDEDSTPPPLKRWATQSAAPGAMPKRSAGMSPAKKGIRGWMSRLLTTPDSRIGWLDPAVRAGLRAIRHERPGVIYSTSPYMTAHLIAMVLSRFTRIPWVADFRDPWRGNPFRELGFTSLERWDGFLEWLVLRSAAHVVCCTPTMTAQLCHRRPFLAGKITTILNAFDRDRFDTIQPARTFPHDHFVLTHAGQFYGPRSPVVWLTALRRAIDKTPSLRGRIHMVLIGADRYQDRPLTDWAIEAGVGDCVHVPGPMTHAETLAHLAGSDAMMLAGAAGLGAELQIPNKMFEYLAIGLPVLATCPPTSPVVAILREARADALICDPTSEIGLAHAISRLATFRHRTPAGAWTGVDLFERSHRARELARVFHRLRRDRTAPACRVLKSASMPVWIALPDGYEPTGAGLAASDDAWT